MEAGPNSIQSCCEREEILFCAYLGTFQRQKLIIARGDIPQVDTVPCLLGFSPFGLCLT